VNDCIASNCWGQTVSHQCTVTLQEFNASAASCNSFWLNE